jgi:signal transduction histidine kinase
MAAVDILHALRSRVPAMERDVPQRATSVMPWLAGAGVVLCVVSVVVAASGSPSDAVFGRGLLQLLVVGVPIGVGIYALQAPGNARFGIALLAVGFAWSLTALAESSSSLLHSIGRLATWVTYPCVVYLLLVFPTGRVRPGLDRAILYGVAGVMLFLFFGTAPLVQAFPTKTLWSTCVTECPPNAFFVLDSQPAFLTDLIYVREWLVELLWLGVFASMFQRWRAASPLQRRAMGPAFVAGAALGVCHYLHITSRQLGAPTDLVVAFSSAWTFCIVAVCTAFLAGLMWRRTLLATAVARLGVAPREDALAAALGDPTAHLVVRDPGSDAWPPAVPPGQAVTTIRSDDGGREAALIHDAKLCDDPELLEAVSGTVRAAWRQERRVNDAGVLERARLARDLHDGAQQRLIALQIRLALAEERLRDDSESGADDIHALGAEIELAIDDLRAVAKGASPSILTEQGLLEALRALSAQTAVPISVVSHHLTRHPMEVESAVYFTCTEAVQNALKHAEGLTAIRITVRQSAQELRFEVRDDGRGFRPSATDGRGLQNMRDRMSAIGGELSVDSEVGRGTSVRGSLRLFRRGVVPGVPQHRLVGGEPFAAGLRDDGDRHVKRFDASR